MPDPQSPPFLHLVDPSLREAAINGPGFDLTPQLLSTIRETVIPRPPLLSSPMPAEMKIPGAPGDPDVGILVIDPAPGQKGRPALLHIHGGGYVLGAADLQSARRLQDIAIRHQCVIVSIDYRLAPETQFPGALNDNFAALRWIHEQADTLGIDTQRIAISGESAGAGHAAMLAIAARNRGEFSIAFQLLIYPMLDDRTASTHAVPDHIGTFVWTRQSNQFGWSALLGVPAGSAHVPAGAVPAREADLSGLPPTFIGVGGLDLFVQEDITYARRLIEAGVPTQLLVVPGAFHGFDLFASESPVSVQFHAAWNDALAKGLAKH